VICPIHSLDDPRLDPYRDLKRTNWTRNSPWFIAEGRWVVRRLLESDFAVLSVLLADHAVESFGPHVPPNTPVLVLPADLVSQLVGFKFHAGVIACGRRIKHKSLADFPGLLEANTSTMVACPHTVLPDNLGSIIRIATAFGAAALLVGERSADPYSRRTIRVSMGNIFQLPIAEPDSLIETLSQLRHEHDFRIVAATGADQATKLPAPRPAPRIVLVLGNEAHGLDRELIKACDLEVSIPMSGATDSLNVANAAAVLLYQFTRVG
jgi:tRNA G18 (ribose-2'-O)-methylase SpoU